jgi:hypothetical protein
MDTHMDMIIDKDKAMNMYTNMDKHADTNRDTDMDSAGRQIRPYLGWSWNIHGILITSFPEIIKKENA